MFELFTDRARQVVVLAREEARTLNHTYIGTEHLLLGLIHEGEGVAARVLESLNISLEATRQRVEEIIGRGQGGPYDHLPFTPSAKKALERVQGAPTGHIPFTPRAKKVLELSLREARQLGHDYIGTEHILLGLIREGDGVAAQVLQQFGADLNRVRQTVIQFLSGYRPGMSSEMVTRQELRAALQPSLFDERQKVVLSFLLEGETTSGIADVLGVSKERVGEIVRSIIETLEDA